MGLRPSLINKPRRLLVNPLFVNPSGLIFCKIIASYPLNVFEGREPQAECHSSLYKPVVPARERQQGKFTS